MKKKKKAGKEKLTIISNLLVSLPINGDCHLIPAPGLRLQGWFPLSLLIITMVLNQKIYLFKKTRILKGRMCTAVKSQRKSGNIFTPNLLHLEWYQKIIKSTKKKKTLLGSLRDCFPAPCCYSGEAALLFPTRFWCTFPVKGKGLIPEIFLQLEINFSF